MNPKLFNKVFVALTLLLTIFYAFWLGADIQAGNTKEAIADGILLSFWLFAFVFFTAMFAFERKMDRELDESRKNLDKAMDDLLGHLKENRDHRVRLEKALHQANLDVCGERPPKPSEFKKIEARFHDITGDHYLRLSKQKGEVKPGAEISDEPFVAPARKKAPVKKPVAKKTVTTKKGK